MKELRSKIEYSSKQTIVEFTQRKRAGKDPHYRKQVLDPSSQLSNDQIEGIREFLPFFAKQRMFL